MRFDSAWISAEAHQLVTSAQLGKAAIPDLGYEQPDGSPIAIDTDYAGKSRSGSNPTPWPFRAARPGKTIHQGLVIRDGMKDFLQAFAADLLTC